MIFLDKKMPWQYYMLSMKDNDNNNKRQVIYVKPYYSYDQVVEIIDERIKILEKIAREMEEKPCKKKKIAKK